MQAFDIYFLGEMLPDTDPADVKRRVAKLFKVTEDAVDRLFSGKPLRVKQNVDAETASRYRAAFRDAGALLEIRMLLFPSFTGLMIYGTVVETCQVKEAPDGVMGRYRHLARIEFTHIREQDREILIRHLLRRQSDQLRDRAEGKA